MGSPFSYVIGSLAIRPRRMRSGQICSATIRSLGVDILQLSIAWAWRPAKEVLNLENFDEEPAHLVEWRRRVDLVGEVWLPDFDEQLLAHRADHGA